MNICFVIVSFTYSVLDRFQLCVERNFAIAVVSHPNVF